MKKIVIASHHKLAFGMKKTVEFLTGFTGIYELSAYLDNGDIREQIKEIMDNIKEDDEVFVFTDILGGSVTQNFFPYCSDKVHVICGMNLPVILSVITEIDEDIKKEDIYRMIEESRESIVYVNECMAAEDSNDE
ncbi:hypothetical protein [Fusobacterium sp.]|uniref:PTS sugar transporter subunit IIA n=1 Tax=Fusobacterium sp. TaxID=68766 RepID=UPI0028FE4026|nr:hypothetical protein [Fusobacterium sp.]MDU1910083.1 hypothetical protein [Fusobacterium sp.]